MIYLCGVVVLASGDVNWRHHQIGVGRDSLQAYLLYRYVITTLQDDA